jgi:hypothetical protein
MLLIIENKDDPTEPIAEETEGGSELVYIPVIMAPAESDARKRAMSSVLDRMSYELREKRTDPPPIRNAEKLLPLFLEALGRTGRQPEYLSTPAEKTVFGEKPKDGYVPLYARG